MAPTADDVVTAITTPLHDSEAIARLEEMCGTSKTVLLCQVADLLYVETEGRSARTIQTAILVEARS